MSTDALLLHAAPQSARVVANDLATALDAFVARERERAFAAGVAEGERRARGSGGELLARAGEALDAAREAAVARLSSDSVELALEIAQRLLRSEVAAGRYDMERVVRESLASSGVGRGACVVHLNPVDAAALASVRFRAGTEIEADAAVARGDVQITTPQGLLVRELDEALQTIGERLRGELA